MGERTGISWTDASFNIVIGCSKVDPGCANCYAEKMAKRGGFGPWGLNTERHILSEDYWKQPIKWNKQVEAGKKVGVLGPGFPLLVFCSSMADVFEDHDTVTEQRERLWPLIRATPWLHWQLLTKRANRIHDCLPQDWGDGYPNVWLGVSVSESSGLWRLEALTRIPAILRFVSYEPALGPINFSPWLGNNALNEQYQEIRRNGLPVGDQWRSGDRYRGEDMEAFIKGWQSMESRKNAGHEGGEKKSRNSGAAGLSPGAINVQPQAPLCIGSQIGLQTLQRGNPRRINDQSQKRSEGGQQTLQFGSSYSIRESNACRKDSESRSCSQSEWKPQFHGKTDSAAGNEHKGSEVKWGSPTVDSQGLPDQFPSGIKNSEKSALGGISWVVSGGESGNGFRPDKEEWHLRAIDQCRKYGTAYFYKQSAAPKPGYAPLNLPREFPMALL